TPPLETSDSFSSPIDTAPPSRSPMASVIAKSPPSRTFPGGSHDAREKEEERRRTRYRFQRFESRRAQTYPQRLRTGPHRASKSSIRHNRRRSHHRPQSRQRFDQSNLERTEYQDRPDRNFPLGSRSHCQKDSASLDARRGTRRADPLGSRAVYSVRHQRRESVPRNHGSRCVRTE